MKAFQSLKYRVVLEGSPKGTAAAIMLGSQFCNQSELVFVVTADNLIEGQEYKDAIIRAKELAKQGSIVAIGVKPAKKNSNFGYLLRDEENVLKFIEKIRLDDDESLEVYKRQDTFCAKWGEGLKWVNKYDGGPHEANFLKLDCSKLKTTFGWKPVWNFDTAIEKSVAWSKVYAAGGDIPACMDAQIAEFFDK